MTEQNTAKVREILDTYLECNHHRKTPERYAVLDAVYSIDGHFTLEELDAELTKRNFRVSRATLYNTMHLFIELRLVMRHSLVDGTKYEACYYNDSHIHQVCSVCGQVTEINVPAVTAAVNDLKLQRFRKDTFALYIYGVCSTCQAKLTRKKNDK